MGETKEVGVLECSSMISVHCSLNLLGSSNPPVLSSQNAGITVS
uniref:Coiled-coil domain containing 30 n=1 Tax=Homo sapiens TaxID=9606 RepID=D6RFH8_HUMAN